MPWSGPVFSWNRPFISLRCSAENGIRLALNLPDALETVLLPLEIKAIVVYRPSAHAKDLE